jgi:hypothetical protein
MNIYQPDTELIESIRNWIKNNPVDLSHLPKQSVPPACSFLGYNHSEESKQKISEGNKGNKHTEDTKKKISEFAKNRFSNPKNNNMYGKKHSKKVKDAQSKLITEKNKNSRWYNNGLKNTFSTSHPGKGWVLGRIMHHLK